PKVVGQMYQTSMTTMSQNRMLPTNAKDRRAFHAPVQGMSGFKRIPWLRILCLVDDDRDGTEVVSDLDVLAGDRDRVDTGVNGDRAERGGLSRAVVPLEGHSDLSAGVLAGLVDRVEREGLQHVRRVVGVV